MFPPQLQTLLAKPPSFFSWPAIKSPQLLPLIPHPQVHNDLTKTKICSKPFELRIKYKLPPQSPCSTVPAYLSPHFHFIHPGGQALSSCLTGHTSVSQTHQAVPHPRALAGQTLRLECLFLPLSPWLTSHLSVLAANTFWEAAFLLTWLAPLPMLNDPPKDNWWTGIYVLVYLFILWLFHWTTSFARVEMLPVLFIDKYWDWI